jgi:hypothetical protein
MNAFIIELKNRPGELAKVTETLAEKGINVTGFTGSTCGDSGTVCILTNDESATRRALQDGHYKSHERELVVATLADRPGSLAEAARRLANAGINVEAAMPTGMSGSDIHVAFATDDPAKARSALGEAVLMGSTKR